MNAPSMIESLEPRQLLSAWTTIGDFPGAGASLKNAIAADGAGNVFVAAGPVVRERLSGGSGWTTILDSPTFDGARLASFYALAMDPARNLYAGGVGIDASGNQSWVVLERPVSATGFSMIDDFQGDPFQQGFAEISEAYISGLAVDAAGHVFAVGEASRSAGGFAWIVRERAADQSAFATVEDLAVTSAIGVEGAHAWGVTTVANGPAAGVYVVGDTADGWLVRKSADGGSSWSTVDQLTGGADGVCADPTGNVYVVGESGPNSDSTVRRTVDGGNSWTTESPGMLGGVENDVTDLAGNLYVAGGGIIRTNAGGNWTTSDDFPFVHGASWEPLARDGHGNLFACGDFMDANMTHHLIVRTLPAVADQPPRVTAASFHYEALPNSLSFTFSKDVSASLSPAALLVTNLDTNQTSLPQSMTYDAATNTATFAFAPNAPLYDGNYKAVLISSSVTDSSGRFLDGSGTGAGGNYTFSFFSLAGDVNHDGTVDFADLVSLVRHYSQPGTFAEGDVDYDGAVDFADLVVLARAYGHRVAAAAGAAVGRARQAARLHY